MGKLSDFLLDKPASKTSAPGPDGDCAYNDHGIRCTKRGSISSGTLGGGAWYCSAHAWVILHDKQEAKLTPLAGAALEALRNIVPRAIHREPGADEGEETAMPSTIVDDKNRDT